MNTEFRLKYKRRISTESAMGAMALGFAIFLALGFVVVIAMIFLGV